MLKSEILINAKNLISDKKHWCKKTEAKDSSGHPVSVYSEKAVRWCALGAIKRVYPEFSLFKEGWAAIQLMTKYIPDNYPTITEYNDYPSRTHEQIMKWFDKAISAAREQENYCVGE